MLSLLADLDERTLHIACAWIMIATGTVTVYTELFFQGGLSAPYGKHANQALAAWFGPTIPARAAWVFQECWSFLIPAAMLALAPERRCLASLPNVALLVMYMGHYFYRSFVYPFRLRGGKPMPVGVCLLAAAFCLFNGYLQGRLWTSLEVRTLGSTADAACFAVGSALWLAGWLANYHSDGILRNLRKPGETRYVIPRGGLFEYVSGANYFGEIVEWTGYAIAARHVGAAAFAYFTFCNTGPRAYHHHLWYKAKFADYPPDRRALVPFVW